MPSKAFKLAESIISNPVMNDIVTNTTAVPATITTQIATATDQGVSTVADLPDTGNNPGDIQLVEATNRLYIWNGSGWYSIALINQTPTWDSGGQPLSSYELDADSPQDATVITLAASDPDGLPIAYSYVTAGSMDSMATISQDSSVFTITPKTVTEVGEGVELTGSITFRASDGVNIIPSVSSFTLSFVTIIENSRYTTLLATSTGTGDNNDIIDSSTNNHTITANGDAHAGTFSPYRHGGYSTYFDGTGDYLRNGTTLTGPSAATFTIECWVYMTANPSNTQAYLSPMFADGSNFSSSIYLFAGPDNDRVLAMYWWDGAGQNVKGNTALNLNQWYHIAFVVNSNDIKIYVDGVEETLSGTTTYSTWPGTNNGFEIGANQFGAFTGYIRDLRVTNTAVYTSNFTAPEQSLTAISGTQLLVCHLPYINDGSTNDYTLNVGGNTSVKPFSPYDNLEYSVADHGGSVYFDGTGDYLTILHNTTLNMGNGSWTAEMWIYPDGNYTTYNTLFAKRLTPVSSTIEYEGYLTPTNGYLGYIGPSGSLQTSTATPITKTWNHVAYVYDGTNIEIFLNGVSVLDQATSSQDTTADLYIGCYNRNGVIYDYYYGYMCDFKLSKGQTTYTATFTPPIAPLSSSGTTLHIKGTDASIIDKSQGNNLKLVGNTTGSTTQIKFADTKSMYFDGSGDRMIVPADTSLNFGTGDFTIEFWINFSALPSNGYIINKEDGSGNDFTTQYYQGAIKASNASQASPPTWSHYTSGIGGISVNTWYHIAYVRSSGTLKSYKDGVEIDSATDNRNYNINNAITIGSRYPGDYAVNFYIQDLRFTKGLARYTANFTPPTEPLEG